MINDLVTFNIRFSSYSYRLQEIKLDRCRTKGLHEDSNFSQNLLCNLHFKLRLNEHGNRYIKKSVDASVVPA